MTFAPRVTPWDQAFTAAQFLNELGSLERSNRGNPLGGLRNPNRAKDFSYMVDFTATQPTKQVGPSDRVARKVFGSGNTAVVYHGYDPLNDQDVAIKVSNEKLASTNFPGSVTRTLFYNGAQAAGALIHPNIVRVLDAAEQDGSPYLVMDYVRDGKTLEKFVMAVRIYRSNKSGRSFITVREH